MSIRIPDVDLGPAASSVRLIDPDVESWVTTEQCPNCDGDQLYLQHISVKRRTKTQRCFDCSTVWESPL